MALKDAAKSKGKGKLAQAAKKRKPATPKVELNHPSMDGPGEAFRSVYNPPKPEDRFQFLKTFATIPGLRSRGSQPQG